MNLSNISSSPRDQAYDFQPAQIRRLANAVSNAVLADRRHCYIVSAVGCDEISTADTIKNYLTSEKLKTVSVPLSGESGKDFKSLVSELTRAFDLSGNNEAEGYKNLAAYMHAAFKAEYRLTPVILGADRASAEDFASLAKTANIIYDRYPELKHKPLFQFVFIGNEAGIEKARKAGFRNLRVFAAPRYEITDVRNHLWLAFPAFRGDVTAQEAGAQMLLQKTGGLTTPIRSAIEKTARLHAKTPIKNLAESLEQAVTLPPAEDLRTALHILEKYHGKADGSGKIFLIIFFGIGLIFLLFFIIYRMFSNFL